MSRKGILVIIAGLVLVAGAVWIFNLQASKGQRAFNNASGTARALKDRRPFRNAVVELTFRSRSLRDGQETMSATGHRTEYIDAAGGRRREDYDNTITALQTPTSLDTETLTMIFDGTKLYVIGSIADGPKRGHVADLREGYDYSVWEDAAVEVLKEPEAQISDEEFMGRPCKVYTISILSGYQKWWVWNGVILRSESHFGTNDNRMDWWEEAVRVEQDGEIDAALFAPPPDVTFEPANQTAAQRLDHHKHPPWLRRSPEILTMF